MSNNYRYNPLQNSNIYTIPDVFKTKKQIKSVNDFIELHPPNINNEIELGNFIYEIDSTELDLGIYTLVSNVTTEIRGISQAICVLKSTKDNSSMISSSSNLFLKEITLEATGLNSQAIEMNGTGVESLDMKFVAFNPNTKYGTLSAIRQAYWADGFSLNAREGFTLTGVWGDGITIFNTRIIDTDNFILGADSTLRISNIRSNMNATIPTGAVAFDFDFINLVQDEGCQIENAKFNGDGILSSTFTGGDSLDLVKSRRSLFKGNTGSVSRNSMKGGLWSCTSEVLTPLTVNTPAKLLGTTTYSNLESVQGNTNNELTHGSSVTSQYIVDGDITLDGGPNDEIELLVRKYDDSASSYITVSTFTKTVSNILGGMDIVNFKPLVPFIELQENDRIEIWVNNITDSTDVTMKNSSFIYIRKL